MRNPRRASVCPRVASISGRLLFRVALQFMELNAVQLLEPLVTELAGEVVKRLGCVLLHVPVQGRTLAALVAADFTSSHRKAEGKERQVL